MNRINKIDLDGDMGEKAGEALSNITEAEMTQIKEHVESEAAKTGRKLEFVPNVGVMDLPEINYEWGHLMDVCTKIIHRTPNMEKAVVVLPVRLSPNEIEKMNRARLVSSDRKSPIGVILKDDPYARVKYAPYVGVRFWARHVFQYAAQMYARQMEANRALQFPEETAS